MGVSGSGKTTVGQRLALDVRGTFRDADDYHPARNIEKMAQGVPLTHADRRPWIDRLRPVIDEGRRSAGVLVLACSALTRRIRRELGIAKDRVRLVYLEADAPLLEARLRARKHFMPPELLSSQLELLEPPAHALVLDAARPVDELVAEIRRAFGL